MDNKQEKNYIGKKVVIHAYKYNGWLYRSWEFPVVLENNDEYYVLCTDNGEILTSECKTKRVFKSKFDDFRIWIFFKNEWFNLYLQIKNNKITYYINISSKLFIEESCFKYVDFDIDYKTRQNNKWIELDIDEFYENSMTYNYSKKLINIIQDTKLKIKNLIENDYFFQKFDLNWYKKINADFLALVNNKKKINE